MSSPWPDWPSRGAWPRGTIRARGRRLNAAPDRTGTARARSVLGQSMPAFGVPPSRKGHSKNSAADVRQCLAEHEHKRAARGAICPVRARSRGRALASCRARAQASCPRRDMLRGAPAADARQRLAEHERKRAARGATCSAEHPPRTCVSVLQSTSASELPKARFAPCGHAPRRDSPGTGLKG